MVLIRIDPASPVPLYEQLAGSIRSQIASGDLVAGEKLPAARELAQLLAVNLHTVLRGYALLRDDGLIDLRRGRGAVVTDSAAAGTAAETARLADASAALFRSARRLGLSADDLVALVRRGYADGPDTDSSDFGSSETESPATESTATEDPTTQRRTS